MGLDTIGLALVGVLLAVAFSAVVALVGFAFRGLFERETTPPAEPLENEVEDRWLKAS